MIQELATFTLYAVHQETPGMVRKISINTGEEFFCGFIQKFKNRRRTNIKINLAISR